MGSKKKIAYVTGTRADFGLMTPVLNAIEKSDKLSLRMYATGMHLMPAFGRTVRLVRKAFPSTTVIPAVFKGNTSESTAAFAADALREVTKAFTRNHPDFALLLGDRPEMLAVATACLYLGIPTGHLHGGERTATADENARHGITKLASLHLPATQDAARRLKRMGEEAWRIRVVGAPALDVIRGRRSLPSKSDLFGFLHFSAQKHFALLVQHPGSQGSAAGGEIKETIAALKSVALPTVAVCPNADAGSFAIIRALEKERRNPRFRIFKNIPYDMFLAAEREAALLIGNSSAALIEGAAWKKPVINLGDRQRGRLRGKNVIDVPFNRKKIARVILAALHDRAFRRALLNMENPWGDGKTGPRVRKILENLPSDSELLSKQMSY